MKMMIVEYPRTSSALQNLEDLLKCSFCRKTAQNPCTLGGCEHIFCSVCCENYLGKNCPTCDIPAHAKDAQVNRQLFNIVTLCQKLRSLLSDEPEKDVVKEVKNNKTGNEDQLSFQQRFEKPDKPVDPLSVYDLSSSSESEIERRKKSVSRRSKNNETHRSIRNGIDNQERTTVSIKEVQKPTRRTSRSLNGERTGAGITKLDNLDDERVRTNKSAGGKSTPCKKRKSTGTTSDKTDKGTPNEDNYGTSSRTRNVRSPGARTNSCNTPVSRTKIGKMSPDNEEISDGFEGPYRTKCAADQTTMTQFFDYMDDTDNLDTSITHGLENQGSRKRTGHSNKNSTNSVSSKNKSNETTKNKKVLRTRTPKTKHDTPTAVTKSSGHGQKRRSSELNIEDKVVTPKTPKNLTPGQSQRKRSRITSSQSSLSSTKKTNVDPLFKKNAKGETPLQIAAIKGEEDKVKELLQAGANPNTRDNAGWTPLHEAVHHGNRKIAELLLDHGAMIDVPGVDNDTPLHDAVCNYKLDCVKLLASRGASLTARNIYGLTPQDCARSEEMKSALKIQVTSSIPDVQCVDVLEYQQPCLLGTFLSRDQKILVQKCAVILQAKVVEEFSAEVTHVILPCNHDGMCPRTIKYLQGVLTGKWIVNIEWIQLCMDYGSRVCEEAFEIPGTSNNPDSRAAFKGRMNRIKQLPGLFDGCQFYFHGNFDPPSPEKEELIDLVKTGGGYILTREPKPHNLDENTFTVPYHAESESKISLCCIYLIHDPVIPYPAVKTARMCTATPSWIMDCIGTFKLLDPADY